MRADLKKKKQDEFALRSLLSSAKADLELAVNACGGPMRKMRQKISRLKHTIRGLCADIDEAISSSSSDTYNAASGNEGECEDDEEDEDAVPLTRRHP